MRAVGTCLVPDLVHIRHCAVGSEADKKDGKCTAVYKSVCVLVCKWRKLGKKETYREKLYCKDVSLKILH